MSALSSLLRQVQEDKLYHIALSFTCSLSVEPGIVTATQQSQLLPKLPFVLMYFVLHCHWLYK